MKDCVICGSRQQFTEQEESLWFLFFGLPILPIEQTAHYWRCEHCYCSYRPGCLIEPSHLLLVKEMLVYVLVGYGQEQHGDLAAEICLKVTGLVFKEDEFNDLAAQLKTGRLDQVEQVKSYADITNLVGKRQIIEATYLVTYTCAQLEFEDRLRINLIGQALGVGLEFVEYVIAQVRDQNHYGINRL